MKGSILDRLIDLDPDTRSDPVQYRSFSYNQMRSVVERDLENLLNTKCFTSDLPESFTELRNSLLTYGLSDFTSKNPATPSVRSELRQEIELDRNCVLLPESRAATPANHICNEGNHGKSQES